MFFSKKIEKGLVVAGCALAYGAFGYHTQNENRHEAQGQVSTSDFCMRSVPYKQVVTNALAQCLVNDAVVGVESHNPVPAYAGESISDLYGYLAKQEQIADADNTPLIINNIAFGALVGFVALSLGRKRT